MSVIIRLQNLPWNANALDIRRYFGGLSIPDGGVHIIGGEYGDAFIAFSTDEDARQAMLKDNGRINGLAIKLLLSSKTEMQNVIAAAKGGAPASQPMPNPPKVGGYFDRLGAPPVSGGVPQFGGDGGMAGVGAGGAAVPGSRGYPGDEFRDGHLQSATYGRMPNDSRTVVNVLPPAVNQPVVMRPSDRMLPATGTDNSAAPYRASDVAAQGYRSDFGPSAGNALGAAWGSTIRGHTGNLPPTSDFGRPGELPALSVADSRGAAYGRDVGRFGDDLLGPGRGYGGDSRGRDYPLPAAGRDFARTDPVRDIDRMDDRRFLAERDFDRRDPARGYFGRDDPQDMRTGRDFPAPIGARDFPPPGPADRWMDIRSGVDDFRGGPLQLPPHTDLPRDPLDRGRDRYDYLPEAPRFGGAYGPGIGAVAGMGPGYGGLPFREPARPEVLPPPAVAASRWSSGEPRDMDRAGPPGGPQWFREPPLPGPPPPVNDLTIHISNLPRSFNYRHVRRFLQNSIIPHDGLKLVNDRSGQRTGTAYIRFADVRSLTAALEKDGTMAEDCKVRIARCDPREFECAVDDAPPMPDRSRSPLNRKSMQDSSSSDRFFFVIKKLPKKVDKSDLKKFLKNFKIAPDGGPFLEIAYGGSLTGNALVEIEKVKDTSTVLKELHHSTFSGSRVDVISISKSEFDERTKRARQAEQDGGKEKDSKKSHASSAGSKDKEDKKENIKSKEVERSSSSGSENRRCVVLRGCPFSTTPALLREFFSGLQIAPNGIHIVFNHERRAAGIAYVEFVTADDQRKALERDRKYLGHRYVEVRTISRSAMIEEYRTSQRSAGGQPIDEFDDEEVVKSSGRGGHSTAGSNTSTTLCMQNLHSDTQLEDILDFFVGYHPIVDSIKLQYKDGQPTGDGLVVFPSAQEAESAMRSKNRNLLLGKPVSLSFWSKS